MTDWRVTPSDQHDRARSGMMTPSYRHVARGFSGTEGTSPGTASYRRPGHARVTARVQRPGMSLARRAGPVRDREGVPHSTGPLPDPRGRHGMMPTYMGSGDPARRDH